MSYRVLGDNLWIDKLILSANMVLQIFLIYNITIQLNKRYNDLNLNHLYVITIFLMSDTVRFTLGSNFLENFLTSFSMLSFLFITLININNKKYINFADYLLSILCILIAVLCNGLVALCFLLVHPILNYNKIKTKLAYFIIPFILFAIMFYLSILLFPDLIYNFKQYLQIQLLPSLAGGARAKENTDVLNVYIRITWYLFKIVITDNVFFLIIYAILLSVKKLKNLEIHRIFWTFLLMFIMFSFPIVIVTPRCVGSTRFFVQTLFIWSIAQAILINDIHSKTIISKVLSDKKFRLIISFIFVILLGVNIAIVYRKDIQNDRYAIPIIQQIRKNMPIIDHQINPAICSTDNKLVHNDNLQSYMVRYLSTNFVYAKDCSGKEYIFSQNKLNLNQNHKEIQLPDSKQIKNIYFYKKLL